MRNAILISLPMLAGLLLGLGLAFPELRRLGFADSELIFPPALTTADDVPIFDAKAPRPKAHVDATTFDFGRMERYATQSHAFRIENRGDADLELKQGKTSCKCTLSGVDKDRIKPGESADVTLEWTAETQEPEFRQTATIHTNDPARATIEFVVEGDIFQQIELTPPGLYVSKLAGETKSWDVRATSVNFKDLMFVGHSFEDARTAEYFDVAYRPLNEEELKAGHQYGPPPVGGCLITVTMKPGLPLGTFRQTIRLATNVAERPQVTLVVTGTIDGDISIVGGRDWNREKLVLSLGAVPQGEGAKRDLKLLVRGAHAADTRFEVKSVTPPSLVVKIGETKALSEGRVQQTELTIELPRDLPLMSYMGPNQGGFGEIVLSTTHPDAPEMALRVRFAVRE